MKKLFFILVAIPAIAIGVFVLQSAPIDPAAMSHHR